MARSLEERFSFVKNKTLRGNLDFALFYVVYLVTREDLEENEDVENAIRKDIMMHTASIIEACLHYTLETLIENKILNHNDLFEKKWKQREEKPIYNLGKEKRIRAIVEEKSEVKLIKKTQFNDLTSAAKMAGVLSDSLYKKIEKIRIRRNRIHFASLDEVDNEYSKEEVNQLFNDTTAILNRLESLLI